MQNTIEYPVTVHAPASVLYLGVQTFLYYLVNILLNCNCWIQHGSIYVETHIVNYVRKH